MADGAAGGRRETSVTSTNAVTTRTTKASARPSEASSQTVNSPTREHGGGRGRANRPRAQARAPMSSDAGLRRGPPRARSDARPPSCLSYAITSPVARPNLRPPAPRTSPAIPAARAAARPRPCARRATGSAVVVRVHPWHRGQELVRRDRRRIRLSGIDVHGDPAVWRPPASGMVKMPGTGPSPGGVAGSTHACVSRRPSVR